MSEFNTTFVNFECVDFKGDRVLSSYALPQTPLTFVPDDSGYNNVLWVFGDGTTSTSLCASKSFEYPGQYAVNLIVYDCNGNAEISSSSQTVSIYDYVTFTFTLSASENDSIEIPNGQIYGPITLDAYYPLYQPISSIYYYASGSNSINLNSLNGKFSHLENTHSIYEKTYNVGLSSYQFENVNKIEIDPIPIYARIYDGAIIPSSENALGAFITGYTGQKDIYYKDDSLSDQVNIKFFFDKNNIKSPASKTVVNHLNNLGIVLSASIVANTDPDTLSITSNGIDGEGFPITSFNISPVKYADTKIPFFVKIKDGDGFSNKNFPPIELSNLDVSVVSGGMPINSYYYSISSLNSTLSSQNSNGAFRGYITFHNLSSTYISDIMINIIGFFTSYEPNGYSLFGVSTSFDLYTRDYYQIFKKNENFDPEETLESLRFQETILDTPVLFKDFLGTIMGDSDSSYDLVGIKTYEKIANFVENSSDVDRNEIYALLSKMEMLDVEGNIYDSSFFNYPEGIKRLVNLASIDKNKLLGYGNKNNTNLNPRGHVQKDFYGKNLGIELDTATYQITAGVPIVALEKFSGDYTVLNTYQPLCAGSTALYNLSAYSDSWGWPLVLPSPFEYSDFSKYYIFYEYVSAYDDTIVDYTIDFGNSRTTVLSSASYNDLFSTYGIFENMFSNTLYDSLSLFSA